MKLLNKLFINHFSIENEIAELERSLDFEIDNQVARNEKQLTKGKMRIYGFFARKIVRYVYKKNREDIWNFIDSSFDKGVKIDDSIVRDAYCEIKRSPLSGGHARLR